MPKDIVNFISTGKDNQTMGWFTNKLVIFVIEANQCYKYDELLDDNLFFLSCSNQQEFENNVGNTTDMRFQHLTENQKKWKHCWWNRNLIITLWPICIFCKICFSNSAKILIFVILVILACPQLFWSRLYLYISTKYIK